MLTVNIKKQLTHFLLDVEFNVNKEITVLYGPSGSGKTTILHMIAGLMKPEAGRIELRDQTLYENGSTNVPVHRRKVGYVFQQYALFPHMTIWDNIQYGMKNEALAKSLLKDMQIDHLAKQYPHEISGGEKQRTALIRALATEPDVLLLDEPFSALDNETKEISYQQLLALQKNWQIPMVLVTHNQEEVERLAHQVVYLREGKVNEIKRYKNLQTN